MKNVKDVINFLSEHTCKWIQLSSLAALTKPFMIFLTLNFNLHCKILNGISQCQFKPFKNRDYLQIIIKVMHSEPREQE